MHQLVTNIERKRVAAARTGQEFLGRLKNSPPNLWYGGERVTDPTTHRAFKNISLSISHLYDIQRQRPDLMLYESPLSGRLVSKSFMVPKTTADLLEIGHAMKETANFSWGMMGRAPDYMNRTLTAYAGAHQFLEEGVPGAGNAMLNYYQMMRENDLCLTHTLITPQANRSLGPSAQAEPFLAARVKCESDKGIVVKGARMLATLPLADEIMVFPSTLLKSTEADAPYAFGASIPTNTPGLKLLCRETLDYGGDAYDHPLGSRFDEMDAVVIFDDVLIPWERVFLYRDVDRCNQAYMRTGALVNMAHQSVIRAIAKTEYLLGLVSLMVDTIGVENFQHIQEKKAEVWVNLEVMRSCLRASEADAGLDEWGVMRPAWNPLDAARNLFPRLYPRMIEIVQLIGASGLVSMPTQADVSGPLQQDISVYFQAARAEAFDRIPIFKLAWDTALSAFGSRQVLYERFYFGDPVRMAGAINVNHSREIKEYAAKVKEGILHCAPA
jgi:4-hydroxyphenylacetate 3-monooxygenase